MRTLFSALAVAGLVGLAVPSPAIAQGCEAGDLDPTTTIHEVPGGSLDAFAPLPDGSVLVANEYTPPGGSVGHGVGRLLPDGTLDPSYGVAGMAHLSILDSTDSYPCDMVATPDGGAITAGYAYIDAESVYRAAIIRFDPDGQLDTSFGLGGYAWITEGTDSCLDNVALQPDGRIVVGGEITLDSGSEETLLARFTADGVLDPTFGTDGIVSYGLVSNGSEGFEELTVTPTGTIVGLVSRERSVIRFTSTGQLDPSFGVGGIAVIDLGGFSFWSLFFRIEDDGGLLIPGLHRAVNQGPAQAVVVRLLPDGSRDTSWGEDGVCWLDPTLDVAISLSAHPDGEGGHFALWRFNDPRVTRIFRLRPDGTVDDTYGDGGSAIIELGADSLGNTTAVDAMGRLVVYGRFDTLFGVPGYGAAPRVLMRDVWEGLGGGLAGAQGTPSLTGSGCPAQGLSYSVDLQGAASDALAFVVVGLSRIDAPFQGGVFIPAPDVLEAVLTDATGDASLGGTWNAPSAAGLEVFLQAWVVDGTGPFGYSASNGVIVRLP